MAKPGIPIDVTITATDENHTQTTLSQSSPLSGYTSELNSFVFEIASLSSFQWNRDNVTWDFGDGTLKTGLSTNHAWSLPGIYDINVTIISEGRITTATTTRAIIRSYYNDQLTLSTTVSTVTAGRPSKAITVQYVLPYHMSKGISSDLTTINLYSSGSLSDPIFPQQYLNNKHDHFKCTWKFKGGFSSLPANTFDIKKNNLYATWDQQTNTYVYASNGSLVGVSGEETIYYIDDTNTDNDINVFASFDTSQFLEKENIISDTAKHDNAGIGIMQTKTAMLPLSVVTNTPTQLVFTSTGLSGFNIGSIKKQGTPIYYYISIADKDGHILKCPYSQLTSKCLLPGATDSDKVYHVNQSVINNTALAYYATTAVDTATYGSFPGAVTLGTSGTNVQLSASVTIPLSGGSIGGQYETIVGASNTFDVVLDTEDNYNVYKNSEDYNFHSNLKSYIGQSNINNSLQFTEQFLKNIFGDNTSTATSLGKTIYEKIENFVGNNSDVNTCNINALYSMAHLAGLDNIEDYRLKYPADIKRLIDLLSINFSNLFGYNKDTIYNFNKDGYTLSEPSFDHGRNLGDKISLSYQVSAGTPIVIKELFNKTYRYILPMTLTDGQVNGPGGPFTTPNPATGVKDWISANDASLSAYPLSSHNTNWGWGLTYPSDMTFSDFYDFYEYRDNSYFTDKSLVSYKATIDWQNNLTTLSSGTIYSDWIKDNNGTIDILYILALLNGFKLHTRNPGYDITNNTSYSACSAGGGIPTTTTTTTTTTIITPVPTDPGLSIDTNLSTENACD